MKQKKIRPLDIILNIIIFLCAITTALLAVWLVGYVLVKGLPNVTLNMLTSAPSELRGTVGIFPMIVNTFYMIITTLLIAVPIGIGAALYLNEYSKKGSIIVDVINFATQTLAGIPSIIYGLFGFIFFSGLLGFKVSILSGALTLSIMILPTLIRTTQEALKSVPDMYREGALGMGAKKLHLIRTILLPSSLPGIITAVILSIGRIVGESAALLFTAGMGYMMPAGFFTQLGRSGATLTVQLYLYASRGENLSVAFSIASILIIIVLTINILTRYISSKFNQERK